MARLSETTLADALENVVPTMTPGDSEQEFAEAYGAYMSEAWANTIPITTTNIPDCESAMAAAMEFDNEHSSSQGAGVIKDGFDAFWGYMVSNPTQFWAGTIAITAPSFSSLVSDLADAFDDNTSSFATLEEAAAALAAVIHPATDNQGYAVYPGPIAYQIT
jgi:hypothetical protein